MGTSVAADRIRLGQGAIRSEDVPQSIIEERFAEKYLNLSDLERRDFG